MFCYTILTIISFPAVCDIVFIVITGNILRSVNDIPIVNTGNIVIPKIVILGFCPIHFTITFHRNILITNINIHQFANLFNYVVGVFIRWGFRKRDSPNFEALSSAVLVFLTAFFKVCAKLRFD